MRANNETPTLVTTPSLSIAPCHCELDPANDRGYSSVTNPFVKQWSMQLFGENGPTLFSPLSNFLLFTHGFQAGS